MPVYWFFKLENAIISTLKPHVVHVECLCTHCFQRKVQAAPINTSLGIALIEQNNVWRTKPQYWNGFHQEKKKSVLCGVVVVMAPKDTNWKEKKGCQNWHKTLCPLPHHSGHLPLQTKRSLSQKKLQTQIMSKSGMVFQNSKNRNYWASISST